MREEEQKRRKGDKEGQNVRKRHRKGVRKEVRKREERRRFEKEEGGRLRRTKVEVS